MVVNAGEVVNVFFVGNSADRAGLLYRKNDSLLGVIRGAAVFARPPPP